jgi:ketosteroid isomerase-like protein
MTNTELINQFYTSFANKDIEGMLACYHPQIEFEDPAFGKLQGKRAGDMWRMLLSNDKAGLKITFSDIKADEKSGSANWTADYTFGQSGRRVHNVISARFEFKDKLIYRHQDYFDLHRWAKQALGMSGFVLGWTSFFKQKLQKNANRNLDYFIQKETSKSK